MSSSGTGFCRVPICVRAKPCSGLSGALRGVYVGLGKVGTANELHRENFVVYMQRGVAIEQALLKIGKSRSWYNVQRHDNPDWAFQVDFARKGKTDKLMEKRRENAKLPFADFCTEYLGMKLFEHQLQWVDILEGKEPRNLHPSMIYEKGEPNYILVNTPPEHAKTFTLSIAYPLWRICMDPNERILIISKVEALAKQMVYAIKHRMTHPRFQKLQRTFGPPGGWKETADSWATNMIYLGSHDRDSGEKDPTIQARGIGQQVYGARATLAICDDAVTLANAHQWEDQIRWIQQEVLTRLGDTGKLLVVGTRVDASDLYKELRNPELYPVGKSPWTYLAQPAVLDYAEKPAEWRTLWPRSDQMWPGTTEPPDSNGNYRRWDGPTMARRRGVLAARTWSLAYQQMGVEEDAVFPAEAIRRAINGSRSPGTIKPGMPGVRAKGMDGLFVVSGVDPAMVGDTAITTLGLDRHTGMRYLLECRVKTGASPTWIRDNIKDVATTMGVNEFRVEKNAFQIFLTQDPELKQYLANLGVVLTEHFTGRNKIDAGYGVASMSVLFSNNLIEFPALHKSEAVRQLVDQLLTWSPETKAKTDLVMSLWFAELKCREIMQTQMSGRVNTNYMPNRFATRKQKSMQHTINLSDYAALEAVS